LMACIEQVRHEGAPVVVVKLLSQIFHR
jgi:hypothetical protein